MCLYNYNNKFNNNKDVLENEEKILLQQIYSNIAIQDNKKAKELTEQLISIQTSHEKIENLQDALNNLE